MNKQIHKRTNAYKLLAKGYQVGDFIFAWGTKLKVYKSIPLENKFVVVDKVRLFFKDVDKGWIDISDYETIYTTTITQKDFEDKINNFNKYESPKGLAYSELHLTKTL